MVLMMKKSYKQIIYSWKFCLHLHFSVQRSVLVQQEQLVDIYEDKKRTWKRTLKKQEHSKKD